MSTALWVLLVAVAFVLGLQVGVYLGQWSARR